jgi:hypothetical protein
MNELKKNEFIVAIVLVFCVEFRVKEFFLRRIYK